MFSGAQEGLIGKLVQLQRGPATVTRKAVSKCHSATSWGRRNGSQRLLHLRARKPAENGVRLACGEQEACETSFDFLAAYVVFENAWYIIPEDKIQGKRALTFYPKSKKAKYEKYREAWHLLEPDPIPRHIDSIQGCAEEVAPEWIE